MSRQIQKTEVPIKSRGGIVFSFDDNPRHSQSGAGLRNLATCIGQQDRAQSIPLKITVYRKAPDERHRNGVAREFFRQRFRQLGTTDASGTQGEETCQTAWLKLWRSDEYARHIASQILRCVAPNVFVEGRISAMEPGYIDVAVESPNPVPDHRETCSSCRLKAFFSAALGAVGASSAAKNA